MEKTAIDLLWLRVGGVGGAEFYVRNLLDGFLEQEVDFKFTLLVSRDNADSFAHYADDPRFDLLIAPIYNKSISKRILWQNLHQNSFLRKRGYKNCFVPVYCKPWLNGGITYCCVIHDIQALHYPKYHPLHEVLYSRLCWRMDVLNAKKIITISDYSREDIQDHYKRKDIKRIYIPITVKKEEILDFSEISNKFNISERGYFYTVAQLIPHKNLSTIIKMMNYLINESGKTYDDLPRKLVVSGIKGNAASEVQQMIKEYNLEENVVLTGFISNEERNTLYKYAHTFLFPSVFEGFGMPPVEAAFFDCPVVTTKCTSIPEATQQKATYVDDPYDVEQWVKAIETAEKNPQEKPDFSVYDASTIAKEYLQVLMDLK